MTRLARQSATSTACTVCRHPNLKSINLALAADAITVRAAAERWNLDRSAVWRHRHRHIPLQLAKATDAASVAAADQVLAEVEQVRVLARGLMIRHYSDDPRVALSAMDRQLRAGELKGRIAGHLNEQLVVAVTVGSPGWEQLKRDLVDALAPHPVAAAAVIRVLDDYRDSA